MARRPYFSGNYGSALGSTANAANLIARAGATQGQMYANMGQQIGGMIQQYGLNKEKRRKEEDTAMGTLAGMSPQELLQIGQENPKLGKAIERATSDQATPRDFQLINASAAPIMAGQLRRVKMEGLQNANKMAELNFGIAKELKDTKINIAKNQGVMSDLATKLAQETDPKKRELLGVELQNQIDSITRLGKPRIEAEEAKLKAVPQQIKDNEKIRELQIKGAERADESQAALLEVFGGAEGKAEFDYKGAKLNRKVIKEGIKLSQKRGEYYDALSSKKVPVDTRKDYAAIQSNIGKIASSTLKDPQTGKQITFADYMDLNADDPNLYPLTGDGAGPAASLYGAYITEQRLAKDLLDSTQVQVDDGQGPTASATSPANVAVDNQTPQDAYDSLTQRIAFIRRKLPEINAQRQQLGQPGQMTPTAFDTSPFGDINTPLAVRPQTVGDVQQKQLGLSQEQANLQQELEQLEARRQQLGQQYGLR